MEKETLLILALAPLLLGGLLYFERRENAKGILPVKTALSLLFILTAVIQPDPLMPYAGFLVVGLFCCLAGDVLLALSAENDVSARAGGLLAGSRLLRPGLFRSGRTSPPGFVLGAILTVPPSTFVYRWLRPHLGDMKVPVLLYVVVISVMVMGAFALSGPRTIPTSQGGSWY